MGRETADPLLTPAQTAQRLGVQMRTLEAWRLRGGGPKYIKVGRLVRYRERDVAEWLASRERTSTSDQQGVS